jgi:hypothetical protein
LVSFPGRGTDGFCWADLGKREMNLEGELLMVLAVAGPLALVLALAILHFYRRSIQREMRNATAGASSVASEGVARRAPLAALKYAAESLNDRAAGASPDPSWPAAAVYVAGGLAFGVVATILVFGFAGIEFIPIRAAAVILGYAWPTVLVLNILWSGDRRRQFVVIAGYAAALGSLCLWVGLGTHSVATRIGGIELPAFLNPVVFWAIAAAPSAYLLLFANRRVRAVGPVVLAFAGLAVAGGVLILGLLGTAPGLRAAAAILSATGLDAKSLLLAATLVGIAIGAPLGWMVVQALARAYDARRLSTHGLVTDTIWLVQSLMVCSSIASENGYWGATGLGAIAAYKLTTSAGFRFLAARPHKPPLRLLLLRVFGFDRRSSRLFDLIASRWRYLGSIRLIAAPDLASRTIDPGKLFAFLRRRLGKLFVHNEAELADRLQQLDERRDPDGRFRVAELFCAGDAWRGAVKRLMVETHLVVMDMRSFSKEHEGCAFELQTLLDAAPIGRLVLLVDRDTNVDLLKSILDARWKELSIASPNARLANPAVPLLRADDAESVIVRRLMQTAALFEGKE